MARAPVMALAWLAMLSIPAAHAAQAPSILVLDGAGVIAATVDCHVPNARAYSGSG